jgi:hypothetical protein
VAGLTVAAVAVPQAMAYALVAGLPVEIGLYTAIVMTAVGALFDSSRLLINGPTNAISIAVLSALAIVPAEQRIEAAILLALLVGATQLVITLLRLGDLERYISHSVVVGFTLGAACLLVLDQIKNLLGLPAVGEPHELFLSRLWETLSAAVRSTATAARASHDLLDRDAAPREAAPGWPLLPDLLLSVVSWDGSPRSSGSTTRSAWSARSAPVARIRRRGSISIHLRARERRPGDRRRAARAISMAKAIAATSETGST